MSSESPRRPGRPSIDGERTHVILEKRTLRRLDGAALHLQRVAADGGGPRKFSRSDVIRLAVESWLDRIEFEEIAAGRPGFD